VRRLALALIVAILTLSASGMASLLVPEPCSGYEPPGHSDNACPPTCVTRGCCARAIEPLTVMATSLPDRPVLAMVAPLPPLPLTDPRPILHVPRSLLRMS
jgi:hypothetical protein